MRIITCAILIAMTVTAAYAQSRIVKLPAPDKKGGISVEEAIQNRRSVRRYKDKAVSLKEVSQMLWAAGGITIDGITGPTRAYASAGGTYPLEIYIVAGKVTGLDPGMYKYDPVDNSLILMKKGDLRRELAEATWGQGMVEDAPFTIVVMAEYEKTTSRYGKRGREKYVPMDAGHLGQNVHLQAESLGLGTVMVGAFRDKDVARVMQGAEGSPVYLIPVGKK